MDEQQNEELASLESGVQDEATVQALVPGFILVAMDASPHSEAALVAAAELAAALHLELRGLFVEDISLLYLCGFSFGMEIGAFTAKPHRLEQRHLEREFRVQAAMLRKIMADIAGQRRVKWSFQVVRGAVTDQLLAASTTAQMMSLGRVGRSPGKRTGSTAQAIARQTQRPVVIQSAQRKVAGPYTLVYTGSVASINAALLTVQLAAQDDNPVTLLAFGVSSLEGLAEQLGETAPQTYVHLVESLSDLLHDLHSIKAGTVILPVDAAGWLEDVSVTVVVVP